MTVPEVADYMEIFKSEIYYLVVQITISNFVDYLVCY